AVSTATDRGATAFAAELAEQALRLTPPEESEDRARRALAAARLHQAAGEWTRAHAIATELLTEGGMGPVRADALLLLAGIADPTQRSVLLQEALRESVAGSREQVTVLCQLAWAMRYVDGREPAQAAVALAVELDDDTLRRQAQS